jgi:GNAT superfamily N-acetyltransferase
MIPLGHSSINSEANMERSLLLSEAAVSDYPALREIFYSARRDSFHWLNPDDLKLSDFDSSTEAELILTAWTENKIAGFISVWMPDRFIHNLFVIHDCRGHGVGTALINEAARRAGLPLSLKCAMHNTSALSYYLSHGWKIEKEETGGAEQYYLMSFTGN